MLLQPDGGWVLLQGSTITRKVAPTGGASPSIRRAEWLYSGVLKEASDLLELSTNVSFDSGSSAALMILGCKKGLGVWSPAGEPRLAGSAFAA
jgi:hypothetical protein